MKTHVSLLFTLLALPVLAAIHEDDFLKVETPDTVTPGA